MESAVTPGRRQTPLERFLRRAGSVLVWAGVVVLGLFGVVFTFANYPWLGVGGLLLLVLLAVYSEQKRRKRRARADLAREQSRARRRELPND